MYSVTITIYESTFLKIVHSSRLKSMSSSSSAHCGEPLPATPPSRRRRRRPSTIRTITVYDAVAGKYTPIHPVQLPSLPLPAHDPNPNQTGRISSKGFIPAQPFTSKNRDTLSSSSLAVAPEEVLFRRRGAPERSPENDIYWASRHLRADQVLPDSDLLKAVHAYASQFYGRRGGKADFESLDGTALIAVGVLLEEWVNGVLSKGGDGVFVEGEERTEKGGDRVWRGRKMTEKKSKIKEKRTKREAEQARKGEDQDDDDDEDEDETLTGPAADIPYKKSMINRTRLLRERKPKSSDDDNHSNNESATDLLDDTENSNTTSTSSDDSDSNSDNNNFKKLILNQADDDDDDDDDSISTNENSEQDKHATSTSSMSISTTSNKKSRYRNSKSTIASSSSASSPAAASPSAAASASTSSSNTLSSEEAEDNTDDEEDGDDDEEDEDEDQDDESISRPARKRRKLTR